MSLSLQEWSAFHYCENVGLVNQHMPIRVKVYRSRTVISREKFIDQRMRLNDALRVFGAYDIIKIRFNIEARKDGTKERIHCVYLTVEKDSDENSVTCYARNIDIRASEEQLRKRYPDLKAVRKFLQMRDRGKLTPLNISL